MPEEVGLAYIKVGQQATLSGEKAQRVKAIEARDGADPIHIGWADSGEPTRLRFKTLAALGDDPTALAKALIDKGCEAQLDLLLEAAPVE